MTGLRELDAKLRYHFPGVVVNKALTQLHEVSRLPRYVAEYLLTTICGDNPTPDKLRKLSEIVRRHYPEPREKELVKKILVEEGTYRLIDEFRVSIDVKRKLAKAEIPCLEIKDAMIAQELLDQYPGLLRGGLWALAELRYEPDMVPRDTHGRPLQSPILIARITPFQVAEADLDEFREKRAHFTTEEWIDVLFNTIGLNPEVYPRRAKLLIISRLIPLVEPNVNMIELGPKATGKTYIYRNISYYVRLIAGGRVSPAVLFYNIARRADGEIALRDCVVFDEIPRMSFYNADEMMAKLKDYMESGHYERGPKKAHSTCSLVFMGNVEIRGRVPVEEFTYYLPDYMRDAAFIDRLHGFVPGWEIPKIGRAEEFLSRHYGFATDYFCEIMHQLRQVDFTHYIKENVELIEAGKNMSIRDQRAMVKLASGMLKLLCPHGEFGREELELCMDIAVEYRQHIADWLHKIDPGEYPRKRFDYAVAF